MVELNEDAMRQMVAGLALATGPGDMRQACLCGKLVSLTDNLRPWHSGIVNYRECLCADCRREYAAYARVVCLGCKTLQMFVKPQKAATGFEFVGKTHYHVDGCPTCRHITSAPVMEHLRYCRDQGKPTNVDLDIVQEAERKVLLGEVAATKMRAELQSSFPTS